MLSAVGRAAIKRIGGGVSTSTNRTLRSLWGLQRVESSKCAESTSSQVSWARSARLYATTTEQMLKPKATRAKRTTTTSTTTKKPATKAKTTTKAKAKAAPKKKKPVAKKKKVVAKKAPVKKAKKVLTDEEKTKAVIKALRTTALLKDEPSSGATTAWKVMVSETSKGTKGIQVVENAREASSRYRSSSPAEMEALTHKANENKAAAQTAYKQWIESHTVQQIVDANNARKLLRRKLNTTRFPLLTDERIPKRPTSAYLFFNKDRYASGDLKNVGNFADKAALVHDEWKALDASEKQKFLDQEKADKQRYLQEFKTVYGRDSTAKVV